MAPLSWPQGPRFALASQLGRTDARDVHVKPLEHGRVLHETVDQPLVALQDIGRDLDFLVMERPVINEK